MKRLRLFFAIILLLLALPAWRLTDLVGILSPFEVLRILALTLSVTLFVALPLKLIFEKKRALYFIVGILTISCSLWKTSALSSLPHENSQVRHCSLTTYTGAFYSVRSLLSEAFMDDLEARNQLCWIRKLITKVPRHFDSDEELNVYAAKTQEILLSPEVKFRTSLPFIALLYFNLGGKNLYDSLHFWINHYTFEISSREYSAWNWPFSSYLQFEYGLIEKNWENLMNSIVLKIN